MKYKRHIIITSGRTGSNFLANTLNLSPDVVNYGEVLGPWTMPFKTHNWALKLLGISYDSYLEYIWKNPIFFNTAQAYSAYSHKKKNIPVNLKKRSQITTLGIKDFYIHMRNYGIEDYFMNQDQLDVIHLRRENLLKRLVSAMLMSRVGVMATSESKNTALEIDIDKLMKHLERDAELNDAENNFISALEKKHPVYRVSYEEYFKDSNATDSINKEIFEFIGVPAIDNKSEHKKILSNELKDVVKNYDELEKAVSSSRFEQYL